MIFLTMFGCSTNSETHVALPLGEYRHEWQEGGFESIIIEEDNEFTFRNQIGMVNINTRGHYRENAGIIYLTTFDQENDSKYLITRQSEEDSRDSTTIYVHYQNLPLGYATVSCSPGVRFQTGGEGELVLAKSGITDSITIHYLGFWEARISEDRLRPDTVYVEMFDKPRSVYWQDYRLRKSGAELVKRGRYRRRYILQ